MWELYWLTRVDMVGAVAVMILSSSLIVFVFILAICGINDEIPDTAKKIRKYACITGIISLIITIFAPTKNDLLLIYGLGPTVDYIQDNEKVQELPDKCVKALNKWVDSLNKEE